MGRREAAPQVSPASSLMETAWLRALLWLPARIIIVKEVEERPSGTAIISPRPITFGLREMGLELTCRVGVRVRVGS